MDAPNEKKINIKIEEKKAQEFTKFHYNKGYEDQHYAKENLELKSNQR